VATNRHHSCCWRGQPRHECVQKWTIRRVGRASHCSKLIENGFRIPRGVFCQHQTCCAWASPNYYLLGRILFPFGGCSLLFVKPDAVNLSCRMHARNLRWSRPAVPNHSWGLGESPETILIVVMQAGCGKHFLMVTIESLAIATAREQATILLNLSMCLI
jgi:hypothetical protein